MTDAGAGIDIVVAKRRPDQFIRVLSDAPALCMTMHLIDLPHVVWVLDNLAEGRVVNQVAVEANEARDAKTALDRMIAIKAVTDEDDLMIITDGGKIIRLRVKDMSVIGRNTQGVRLINLEDQEKVVSVAKAIKREEE